MIDANVNSASSPIASTLLVESWLMYVGLLAKRMRRNISDSDCTDWLFLSLHACV